MNFSTGYTISKIILTLWLQAMCPQILTYYLAMYVAILYNNYAQYYVDQQLDYSVAIYSYLTIASTSPYKVYN